MSSRALLLLPVSLAACGGDKDPPPPVTDTEEPTEEPRESGTPVPEGGDAAISVIRYGQDAFSDADQTLAFATFVGDDAGSLNYLDCLLRGYCFTDLGAPGGAPEAVYLYAYPRFLDGGDVSVGAIDLPRDPAYDVASADGFAWPGAPAAISTTGGVDLGPYAGTAAVEVAEMELLTPSPTALVPMGPAQALDLTWTPGTAGDVLITVFARNGVSFYRPEDDGSTTVPANAFAFTGALDGVTALVSRIRYGSDTTDPTFGLRWWAEDTRVLYLDFRNLGDIEELPSTAWSEDCAGLKVVPPTAAGTWFVDTSAALNDLELPSKNPLTTYPTPGGEILLPIDLLPGQRLTATWRTTFGDASLYLLTDACDPDLGLTGSDESYQNEDETIVYTATSAESVILVLDAFDQGSPGLVEIAIE